MIEVRINRPPPPVETVDIIGIPYDAARTLLQVLDAIGGDPSGPRGHVDMVVRALLKSGVVPARHVRDSNVRNAIYLIAWEKKET